MLCQAEKMLTVCATNKTQSGVQFLPGKLASTALCGGCASSCRRLIVKSSGWRPSAWPTSAGSCCGEEEGPLEPWLPFSGDLGWDRPLFTWGSASNSRLLVICLASNKSPASSPLPWVLETGAAKAALLLCFSLPLMMKSGEIPLTGRRWPAARRLGCRLLSILDQPEGTKVCSGMQCTRDTREDI